MSDYSGSPSAASRTTTGNQASLSGRAAAIGDDIKAKASGLAGDATQAAKQQFDELSGAAKEMASNATERLSSAVDDQRSAGADYIGKIATAVHRAAGEFEADVPQAVPYIRKAAARIDTVAQAVRQQDMSELLGEVQQFARRQPTAFFGGAIILGFAAVRFFKSSASGVSSNQAGQDSPTGLRSSQTF